MKPIIVNDHHDGWLSGLHVTDVRDGRMRVEEEKACTVCHVTLLSDKAEMLKSTGPAIEPITTSWHRVKL